MEWVNHGNAAALAKMVPTKPGHLAQSRWTQNSSPVGQILDLEVIHMWQCFPCFVQKKVAAGFCISFDNELCWICLHPEDHESSAAKQDTRTDFDNLGAKGQIRKFTLFTHHPHSSSPLASSLMYYKNPESWDMRIVQNPLQSIILVGGIEILVLQLAIILVSLGSFSLPA